MSGTLNVVLATYYKTSAPGQIEDQFDISYPLALREVWKASRSGTLKVSSAGAHQFTHVADQIQLLGGFEKASRALQENSPWLQAWDDGQRQGVELARAQWVAHMERAHREKRSEAPPEPEQRRFAVPTRTPPILRRVLRGY